jgi:hypothetical protein
MAKGKDKKAEPCPPIRSLCAISEPSVTVVVSVAVRHSHHRDTEHTEVAQRNLKPGLCQRLSSQDNLYPLSDDLLPRQDVSDIFRRVV